MSDDLAPIASTARLLIALDFDGTLSPLQDEPMAARMLPAAREALNALAALPDTTVALVSGRTLGDLRVISEHGDDSVFLLSGSHGAEFWHPGSGAQATPDDAEARALRDDLQAAAEDAVAGLDGAWIEPKTFGLGLHTRLASDADSRVAEERVDALLAERAPHWRRRSGRNIVEYAYRHEGKDSAVAALRERVRATAVLFAGDDVTDEDALRSLGPGDLGVRVGEGETAARIRVPDADALATLLLELARRRADALGVRAPAAPEGAPGGNRLHP
ncbi:trehalose-phosphatase [Microbacterium caowuchunii]|uniref:trehalose-phosphatase n=1 Tax=Microbacterium caowuchunii TaxID=2614638 RepID=UPI001CD5CF5B|nr:trehalose-phosphatase [Microbacterium caowuchunii]